MTVWEPHKHPGQDEIAVPGPVVQLHDMSWGTFVLLGITFVFACTLL